MMQFDTSLPFKAREYQPDIGTVINTAMSISDMLNQRKMQNLQMQQVQQQMAAQPQIDAAKQAQAQAEAERQQQEHQMKLEDHKQKSLGAMGDMFDDIDPDKDPDWKQKAQERAQFNVDQGIFTPTVAEQINSMSSEQFKALRNSSNLNKQRASNPAFGVQGAKAGLEYEQLQEKVKQQEFYSNTMDKFIGRTPTASEIESTRTEIAAKAPNMLETYNKRFAPPEKPKEGEGPTAKAAEKIKKLVNELYTQRAHPMTKARIEYEAATDALDILNKPKLTGYDIQQIFNKLNVQGNTGSFYQQASQFASKFTGKPQKELTSAEQNALRNVAERELADNSRKLQKDLDMFEKNFATELRNSPEALDAFNAKRANYAYTPSSASGGSGVTKSGKRFTILK